MILLTQSGLPTSLKPPLAASCMMLALMKSVVVRDDVSPFAHRLKGK